MPSHKQNSQIAAVVRTTPRRTSRTESLNKFIMDPVVGHGTFSINCHGFPQGLIGAGSAVLVTISELHDEPPAVNVPYLGDAVMGVDNIVPYDNGTVDVVVTVAFPNDLTVGLTVTVVN